MKKYAIFAMLGLASVFLGGASYASPLKEIFIASYYSQPPFVIERGKKIGLVFDLARQLTEIANGEYTFEVMILPRKRLDWHLESNDKLIVPFVSPSWFGDENGVLFGWTPYLMQGGNAVVSSSATPFEYDGPVSLIGKRIGVVSGYRLKGLQVLIANGNITRFDIPNERLIWKMLKEGRIDVGIVPNIVARYLEADIYPKVDLHFSSTPHQAFTRHVLISGHDGQFREFLNKAVIAVRMSSKWQSLLTKYGTSNHME